MLRVGRQTRASVEPARLGMNNEQALKAPFLGTAENFEVLELLKATQWLLRDYYAGQPLPNGITLDYLRQLQRHLYDPITAWQSRTPKLKLDRVHIQQALQQTATHFVLNSKGAAALIKKRTLTPNLEPETKKEEQPQPTEEEEEDEDPFADVHNPSPETVSESEFFAAKELAEAQWRRKRFPGDVMMKDRLKQLEEINDPASRDATRAEKASRERILEPSKKLFENAQASVSLSRKAVSSMTTAIRSPSSSNPPTCTTPFGTRPSYRPRENGITRNTLTT